MIVKTRAVPSLLLAATLTLAALNSGCGVSAGGSEYFGKVEPPAGQVLRYVTGPEPETLDPQMSTGQSEARIYMALFEGLVEYHPKTMQPIPGVAERWVVNPGADGFVFHLRRNARFSNGDPINAHDFVYTIRRGLNPKQASRSSFFGWDIKYAEAYNHGGAFVRDPSNERFLLASEAGESAQKGEDAAGGPAPRAGASATGGDDSSSTGEAAVPDTEFHRFISSPARLVVPGDEKGREKAFKANPKLKDLIAGRELVPVRAEDVGVEAVDDYTLRITLSQPAPYFLGVLPHPFFRAVPRKVIETHGAAWAKAGNIVGSGPFKLAAHRPYNDLVVERNPEYWDAANVRLDRISFYPLDAQTTMLNLYKAGDVDAVYNHAVPAAWLKAGVSRMRDYMDAPENVNEYLIINTTKPPMTDVRVRRAFSLAIDRRALAEYRVVAKPLASFVPEGIYLDYPQPKAEMFNPERARQLLAEAGYRDASGTFDPKRFPIDQVEFTYNTGESQQKNAEFIQAQWKHHLGLTVQLRSVESRTFSDLRSRLEYKGFARQGWGGDYVDPNAFLSLFTSAGNDNGTGWLDPKYVRMLREANHEPGVALRYKMLAEVEAYMLDAQPVIPLYTPATSWMKKPYVKGLYPNPGTLHAWKFVYIEHDAAKWDRGMPDMTNDRLGD